MPQSRSRPLARYLGPDTALAGGLVARALELAELTRTLHRFLEPSLQAHCQVANIRDGTLVLLTDSPAWASKLRYLTPALMGRLAAELPGMRQAKVIVRPPDYTVPARHSRHADLSAESAELLRHAAQAIDYGPLREALLRLSSRR